MLLPCSYDSLKVQASLEEQEFNEVWGQKAKDLFNKTFDTFKDAQLQKIINSIWTLGASNLNASDRLEVSVCFISTFCEGHPSNLPVPVSGCIFFTPL